MWALRAWSMMSTGTSSLCARFHSRFSTLWAITPSLSSSASLRMSSRSFSRCFLLALVQLAWGAKTHFISWLTDQRNSFLTLFFLIYIPISRLTFRRKAAKYKIIHLRLEWFVSTFSHMLVSNPVAVLAHSPWNSQRDDPAARERSPMPALLGDHGHFSQ